MSLTLSWTAHSQSGLHVLSQHHICLRISQPVPSSETKLGPSLAARVVLSFGAAMLAVPLSPRRRGGQTPRDTARFTPSPDTFLPRPLTRCVWGGCRTVFVGVARAATGTQNASKAVFSTPKVSKSGEGLCPFEPRSKGGTPPLETPPVLHCFSGQCGRKSGHFFRELSLSVHGRDGLSRPFPRLVRGSNEVGRGLRCLNALLSIKGLSRRCVKIEIGLIPPKTFPFATNGTLKLDATSGDAFACCTAEIQGRHIHV